MKIKVINPNTTLSMTASIEGMCEKVRGARHRALGGQPETGVNSIECYVDEYLAIPGVLKEIVKGDRNGERGCVHHCLLRRSGLQAAREVTDKPVLGIAESAIAAAKMIAPYFSIVSVLDRSVKVTEDVVYNNGAEKFCRSIRSTGLAFWNLARIRSAVWRPGPPERRPYRRTKAECILLGLRRLCGFCRPADKELGVPVLDGVMPAVKFAEALVGMNQKISKVNTWKYPEPKEYKGFDIPYRNK